MRLLLDSVVHAKNQLVCDFVGSSALFSQTVHLVCSFGDGEAIITRLHVLESSAAANTNQHSTFRADTLNAARALVLEVGATAM